MGKKCDLSNFERGMVVFHNLLSYWDFHAQPFLGFTKNGVKREKHPVCAVDETHAFGVRDLGCKYMIHFT